MKFKTLQGRIRKVNINDYAIEWDNTKTSLSKFQFGVKQFLKPYWIKKPSVGEEVPMAGSKNRFDFLNATDKIVVECDGEGHTDPNFYLHETPMDYLNQLRRDHKKQEWCTLNGYTLVRIFPTDLPLTKEFFKDKYKIEL